MELPNPSPFCFLLAWSLLYNSKTHYAIIGEVISTNVLPFPPFEFLNEVIHQSIVEVPASKVGVSSCGPHFNCMVAAVGSLIIRRTLRPAITPACKVEKQSNSTMKEANSVVATQEEEQVGLKSERRIWVWGCCGRERGEG
jgi:hypothetical protein